jgi:transcription antitermination protein NusB
VGTRRQARKRAMQILFELDVNSQETEAALRQAWKEQPDMPTPSRTFTENLVRGTLDHLPEIDGLIKQYAENWDIKRMGGIDKNVMRVALYEMLYCEDIPPVVSINEAVDIAKEYGDVKSGRFVNGILDRARKDLTRSPREAVKRQPARKNNPAAGAKKQRSQDEQVD